MNNKKIISGASLIGLIWIVSRILGAALRIFISPKIGLEATQAFVSTYPMYFFVLVVSTFAIPNAISKIIASRIAIKDYKSAHGVFVNSLFVFALVGLVATLVGWFVAKPYGELIQIELSVQALKVLSISYFFSMLIACFRGYFQALKLYTISWLSQLLIQLLKIIFVIICAYLIVKPEKDGPEIVAAFLCASFVVAQALTLGLMIVGYFLNRQQLLGRIRKSESQGRFNYKAAINNIIFNSIYSFACFGSISVLMLIDNLFFAARLADFGQSEITIAHQSYFLGAFSTIIFPALLVFGLCFFVLPTITRCRAKKELLSVQKASGALVKTAIAISLPCFVGLFVLAQPITNLLFSSFLKKESLDLAAAMIKIMSVSTLFLSISFASATILQAIGRSVITLFTFLFAVVFKIIVLIVLTQFQTINVQAFAFSTVVFCVAVGLLNTMYAVRLSGLSFKSVDFVVKPIFAAVVMGVIVYFAYNRLLLNILAPQVACVIAIIIGALLYSATIAVVEIYKVDEIEFVPGISAFANSMSGKEK